PQKGCRARATLPGPGAVGPYWRQRRIPMTLRFTSALATVLAALSLAGATSAQTPRRAVSEWPKPATFPNEDRAAALEHFRKARAFAVGDLFTDFTLRCITDPKYRGRVNAEQYAGVLAPTKVFDQLFYVGQMSV